MVTAIGIFALVSLLGIAVVDCRQLPKGKHTFPASWKIRS